MLATIARATLADVIAQLPQDCTLVRRFADQSQDGDSLKDELVLVVDGNLQLPSLDLDAPLAEGSPLRAVVGDVGPSDEQVYLIFIKGSLAVDGAVTNLDTDGATSVVVMGDVQVGNAVIGGQLFDVRGSLVARDLFWGDYNHGSLRVAGDMTARVAVFTDEYDYAVSGKEQFEFLLDDTLPRRRCLNEFSSEAVPAVFLPEIMNPTDDGEDFFSEMVDRDKAVALLREGRLPVGSSDEIRAALPPVAHDLFNDEEISMANVLAIVRSGIIPEGETASYQWCRQLEFTVIASHVDEDGDQLDDDILITDWLRFKFSIGVTKTAAKRGLFGFGKKSEATQQLNKQWRVHDKEPNENWQDLTHESGDAWRALQRAWPIVLDYARKTAGQQRAGWPLWQRVRREITPERLEALCGLPVFVEEFNDWWDEDKNGFWRDDLWIGVRQAGVRDGETHGLQLRLSWENGDVRKDDDEDDVYASYDCELSRDASGRQEIKYCYRQRQSGDRYYLSPSDTDHLLRLIRFFDGAERVLMDEHQNSLAEKAEADRIAKVAVLLGSGPVAQSASDDAVFPPAMLQLSDEWQQQGKQYVAEVNAYHARRDAGEECDEVKADPRKPWAATALQLCRRVNERGDAALHARFRRRFCFAPDAFNSVAQDHGQFIGPVLAIDNERLAVRLGPAYDDDSEWVVLQGPHVTPLENVKGIGRSHNRKTWVFCYEGGEFVTRNGFDGPVIAEFSAPLGTEGLPDSLELETTEASERCDEAIPFNDGECVLLRNPTGIYLLSPQGVKRIHPQEFEEEGPYSWPKNQQDGGLSMDMMHMALSPDKRFIALGDQDSPHILLRSDGTVVRTFDTLSDYPHYAVFSEDSNHVALNSCHFYHGATLLAKTDSTDEEPATLEDERRVYTAVASDGHFIVGCANGYLSAIRHDGSLAWRHHVGSSMSGIDISPDGSVIWAASYGGYLARLERTPGAELGADPFSIGASPYLETARWLFWENEARPLLW